MPLPLTNISPRFVNEYLNNFLFNFKLFNETYFWGLSIETRICSSLCFKSSVICILPQMPVESILDATFTVLPQMSYRSLVVPITPAVTSPQWAPIRSLNLDKFNFCFLNNNKVYFVVKQCTNLNHNIFCEKSSTTFWISRQKSIIVSKCAFSMLITKYL